MKNVFSSFLGALIFYTIIPLPSFLPISFNGIALWLPWVGLILGFILNIFHVLLSFIGFPPFTKALILVAIALWLTGGLHFDGLMDTADGLAVKGKEKSLEVMADSRVGAFGVMSGIIVILLKVCALGEMTFPVAFALILALSWSRWGQFMAIILYPYSKEKGKGKFLQEGLKPSLHIPLSFLFTIPVIFYECFYLHHHWWLILSVFLGCAAIALFFGWYLQRKLSGHTGDTYGATVEWSEAMILTMLTII